MAIITASVSTIFRPSIVTLRGLDEKSTPVAMPKRMSTPSCCACFFMASINSAPSIPSGNPGKFSILVVVVS